jgi:hypothetical protein
MVIPHKYRVIINVDLEECHFFFNTHPLSRDNKWKKLICTRVPKSYSIDVPFAEFTKYLRQ